MIRPRAIIRYERLYWASFVLETIVSIMNWTERAAVIGANPLLAKATWLLPTIHAIGVVVTILLWYFTARRPGVVAKWVVVVLAALTLLGVALTVKTLATGHATLDMAMILSFVADALYVAAAITLFGHDAKPWFGERPDPDSDDDMSHDV